MTSQETSPGDEARSKQTLPEALKRILNLLPYIKAHETFTDRFRTLHHQQVSLYLQDETG
jgi:hypothetical protein